MKEYKSIGTTLYLLKREIIKKSFAVITITTKKKSKFLHTLSMTKILLII